MPKGKLTIDAKNIPEVKEYIEKLKEQLEAANQTITTMWKIASGAFSDDEMEMKRFEAINKEREDYFAKYEKDKK